MNKKTIRNCANREARRADKTTGRKPEGLLRLQAGVITPANGSQWYTNPEGVAEPFDLFCRTFGAPITGCH